MGTVQDAFQVTNKQDNSSRRGPRPVHSKAEVVSQLVGDSISPEELSAVLTAHRDSRMASMSGTSPPLPQLPGEGLSTNIPQSQLLSLQQQDAELQ